VVLQRLIGDEVECVEQGQGRQAWRQPMGTPASEGKEAEMGQDRDGKGNPIALIPVHGGLLPPEAKSTHRTPSLSVPAVRMDEVITRHCAIRISRQDYFTGFHELLTRVIAGVVLTVLIAGAFGVSWIAVMLMDGSPDASWIEYLPSLLFLMVLLFCSLTAVCIAILAVKSDKAEQMAREQWEHDHILFAEYKTR
jgi:hypothetical protein